ncbi:MAG: zinc-ribbon domain-containing protein [Promethearchaeota archaeon]|nr:MAG: zinc-ribbon domain-containing protein [Candidatus Lokiarchaeota archaeon]
MSENELNSLWNSFGKNINLVAIMTILTLVTGITGIIALIFLFLALGNIKMINYRLNSQYLDDFRSKYITSFILKMVTIPILIVGIVLLVFPFGGWYIPGFWWINLVIGIVPLIIAVVLFIVSYSFEMKAWENLKFFLEENRSMFPEYLVRETIDGAEKLRTGALLNALGFLIITAIVGFILQIIGFFKLAKFENFHLSVPLSKPSVQHAPVAPTPQEPQSRPSPYAVETKVVGTRPRFCPNCGAELKEDGKFCSECGSKIN